MWLKALTSWDSKISWGTAALAYLYRQLDEACRRSDPQACIGGPLLLLSVWMWSRLSVGRPDVLPHDDWDEYGMRQCRPTWAFFYDKVEPYVGKTKTMYKYYSNEFDSLTPGMVNFHTLRITFPHLWRMQCPLICLYAVEYHLPQRVMTKFGLFQETPPEWKDTSIDLHRLDRMQQKTITNWADHHSKYIIEWWEVLRKAEKTRDDTTYSEENTRWEVNAPAFTQQETLELPNPDFGDIANLQYNRLIRDGRPVELAPVLRFVAFDHRSKLQGFYQTAYV
nr:serine/threonine-protein phosphatase 7 long form homolog [Lolium perenne]